MRTALDKKMRLAEIVSSVILLIISTFFELYSYMSSFYDIRNIRIFSVIAFTLIPLLFIIGIFRKKPWNTIMGVLYIFLALPHLTSFVYSLTGLVTYLKEAYSSYPSKFAPFQVYNIMFVISAVVCALMYFGVIKFRKRKGLIILMYLFIISGAWNALYTKDALSNTLIIIFGLCFYPENNETGCKKGKVARTFIYLFIPFCIILLFTIIISVVLTSVSHILEDGSDITAIMIALLCLLICFIAILTFPLLLFDKKTESAEITEKSIQNV